MPRISILLPTYNGAAFLRPQVASILAQSQGDFELLAADDGSSDGTVALLEDLAREDARIRVVPTGGNDGQKRRLAMLATEARAPLLAVTDQDDVWHPRKLELLEAALPGASMAFGSSHLIDADGHETGRTLAELIPPAPQTGDRLTYLFKPVISAHATLMHRAFFSAASTGRATQFDWLQSLDAAFADGVVFVPEAITYHRIHATNQSNGHFGRGLKLRDLARLAELARYPRRRTAMRWSFVGRLEHLGNSDLLSGERRDLFHRAFHLCMRAWFAYERAASAPRDVRASLEAMLLPLAGNDGDCAFAARQIAQLCSPALHPASLADDVVKLRRRRG